MAQHFKDYYKILGISYPASEADIRTGYRKMARLFHPDMHPEDTDTYTALFQEITEAHEILSDDYKKEAYDRKYRQAILGEELIVQEYYYDPQEYVYQEYQPPVERKRKTYASYAAFILMGFYFIRIIFSSIPAATNEKQNYSPISPGIQQHTFLNTPEDTSIRATPVYETKRPW